MGVKAYLIIITFLMVRESGMLLCKKANNKDTWISMLANKQIVS